MKNYKGLLQEYCQKQNITLPIYNHLSIPSTPTPKWKTKIITTFGEYTSTECNSKKEADQMVAEQVYNHVINNSNNTTNNTTNNATNNATNNKILSKTTQLQLKPLKPLKTKDKIIVLIDLENYPQMDDPFFFQHEFVNIDFIGFVGKCSSHAQKNLDQIYPFMKTITVNSVLKDAADHMISIYTGMLLLWIKIPFHIIIITRDRFAGCTIDGIKQLSTELDSNLVNPTLNSTTPTTTPSPTSLITTTTTTITTKNKYLQSISHAVSSSECIEIINTMVQ